MSRNHSGGPTTQQQERTRQFVREFFKRNPDASTHAAMKAVNNAHLSPIPHIVAQERAAARANQHPDTERVAPHTAARAARANGPQLDVPEVEPEAEEEYAAQPAVPEEDPMPPSPQLTAVSTPTEKDAITAAARALVAAMRMHGIAQLVITIDDPTAGHSGGKAKVEWSVVRRTTSETTIEI